MKPVSNNGVLRKMVTKRAFRLTIRKRQLKCTGHIKSKAGLEMLTLKGDIDGKRT